MKIPLLLVVVSAFVWTAAACVTGDRSPKSNSPTVTLSVIGTNDLHGAILPTDGRGGLALLAGYLSNVRAQRTADGGAVLLLDAGDLFQGSLESNLTEGAVVVSAYNAMGYAAAAIGNHDFDFGPLGEAVTPDSPDADPRGALKARAAEASFPFLAANIIDESTGGPVAWSNVRPSTILTVAGFRVGIVGLTTAEALSATMPANTRGLAIAPLAATLQSEAARLREDGATIVVALAHAGGACSAFDSPTDLTSCSLDEEIFSLARDLPRGLVDGIVAGHRHQGIAHEIGGVPIVAAYWRGRAFGRIDLEVERATGRVKHHRIFPPHEVCAREDDRSGQCVDESSSSGRPAQYEGLPVAASEEIDRILAPAVGRVRALKETPLNAEIEGSLPLSSRDESPLGNLITDWMRAVVPKADAAITNAGNVRAPLSAGPLTYGRLFEMLPFDNREVLIRLTGAEFRRLIEHNLQQSDSILLVSGVRAVATCENGRLRVALRRDSGAPVRDGEILTAATSDFLASGGDDFFAPIQPLRVAREDGPLIRDHVADWLKKSGRRWRGTPLTTPAARRIAFPGTRPVTCKAS